MNSYTLTENGQPKATIVIGKHPTPAAAFAAREMQYHIQKISGATPAVVTDNTPAMQEARKLGPLILIGDSAAVRETVDAISFEPQEYMVGLIRPKKQANGPEPDVDTIVLWGCDEGLKDFEYTTVPGRGRDPDPDKNMPTIFGNACRFTENNRPITVTGIDMDPYCGSLEAWVRPWTIPGNAEATILRIPAPSGRHILQLLYGNTKVRVRYWAWDIGINKHIHLNSPQFDAKTWCNNWHHICATYEAYHANGASGLEFRLYVDGSPVSETKLDGAKLGGQDLDVYVGGYVEGRCSRHDRADFRGAIDEVRISRCVRQPPDPGNLLPAQPYTSDRSTSLLLHFDESDGAATVRDDVRKQNMIYEHRCRRPALFEARGSLDAVYDFLERFYSVRWYAPTEIGMVYDPQPTMPAPTATDGAWVAIPADREASIIRRKPAMAHRSIHTPQIAKSEAFPLRQSDWFMVGPPGEPRELIPNAERDLWLLRMRLGGTPRAFGHSLPSTCAEYLKEQHPAWLAHDGKDPATVLEWYHNVLKRNVPAQMCYTHEPLIAALVEDIYSHFKDKPAKRLSCYDPTQSRCLEPECNPIQDPPRLGSNHTVHSYSLSPDDNAIWCQCEACKSQREDWTIPPPPNGLFSNDTASTYIHNFTRIVAQRVNALPKAWEGQKWIGQTAYGRFAHYPKMEGFTVEPNVCTWLCLHARTLWSKEVQANDKVILNDWRQHAEGKQLGAYLYYLFPVYDTEKWPKPKGSKPFRSFPGFCASHVANLFTRDRDPEGGKHVGFKGLAGVHVEMSGEYASFLIDQLELYLTFQLANDPEQSGDALTEEFFKRYYGPAAQSMRALYRAIENRFTNPPIPADTRELTEKLTWGSDGLGSPDELAGYLKHVADAVVTTRRTSADTPFFLGRGTEIAHLTGEPTVHAERVDLFRRGVWDYMFEGYRNYWKSVGRTKPILTLRIRWHVTQRELKAIVSGWQAPLELRVDLTAPFSSDELSVVTEWPHELLQMWNEYSIDTNRLVLAVIHKGPALGLPQIGYVRAAGDLFIRSIADRICAPFTLHSIKAEVIDVISSQPLLDELLRLGLVDTDRKSVPVVAQIEWSD